MGVCVCVCVCLSKCICVHSYQRGEGMLRFVSTVKAPQVSSAHICHHCLFHKRRPYLEYARLRAEVCASSPPAFSLTDQKI